MIMERLNGPTLRQYMLDKTELDEGEAAFVFKQVAGAVVEAQRKVLECLHPVTSFFFG